MPRSHALRAAQGRNRVSPSYLSKQTDINAKMRAILIDWLVEVHLKFELMPETLYLTVNLVDRYLEKEQVMRGKLQLVGVTAMFMASKYVPQTVQRVPCEVFVCIAAETYPRDELLSMERHMRASLNFQLTTPITCVFLRRLAKVAFIVTTPRSTTELLANYLVELTLQDYKMLKYLPSTICASAVYLALKTSGQTPWVRAASKLPYHRHATPRHAAPYRARFTQLSRGASFAPCFRAARALAPTERVRPVACVADARPREALGVQ